METKSLALDVVDFKFDDARPGVFSGYASVFGGVDSYGDTILPGAYKDTLQSRKRPIQMRWNHYGDVIGKWVRIEEDEKGLYVEGELTPGHSKANDVYALIKHGAVTGLSIGFRPVKATENETGGKDLHQINLVEISVVESPADLGAQISGVKSLSEKRIKAAIMWLKRAIKLHEGHMDGSVETSEESQMTMMDQMKKALELISAPDDSGGGMGGMSKSIFSACSLKEIESLLRDAAGFSRADATALVSRIKTLTHGEREAKEKTSEETTAAILAHIKTLTARI